MPTIPDRELAKILVQLGYRMDPARRRRLLSDKLDVISELIDKDRTELGEVTEFGHLDTYLLLVVPLRDRAGTRKTDAKSSVIVTARDPRKIRRERAGQ